MVEFIEDIFYIILAFLALIILAPLTIIFMILFAILTPFIVLYCILAEDENI